MIADVAKKHLRHLMTEARAAALRFVDVEKWGVSLRWKFLFNNS